VLGLLIVICGLGLFYRHISFGAGLADYFGYLFLFIVTILHTRATLNTTDDRSYRRPAITYGLLATFIIIKATFWRGREYPWNGSVFYLECPHKIHIRNGSKDQNRLVGMCYNYDSKFSAVWDGHYMHLDSGNIIVPEELHESLSKPFIKVALITVGNSIPQGRDWHREAYPLDSLKTSNRYKVEGVIDAIEDSIPVIYVQYIEATTAPAPAPP
jgi:hypothetical protein